MGAALDRLLHLTQVKAHKRVSHSGKVINIKAFQNSKTPKMSSSVGTAWRGEVHAGTSNKFFESAVVSHDDDSATHTTRYGSTKPGAHVTETKAHFATYGEAHASHIKKVKSKQTGGYLFAGDANEAAHIKAAGVTGMSEPPPAIKAEAQPSKAAQDLAALMAKKKSTNSNAIMDLMKKVG